MSSTVVQTLRQSGRMVEVVDRNSLACIPGLERSPQQYPIGQVLGFGKPGGGCLSEMAEMLQHLQSPQDEARREAERRLEWMATTGFGQTARLLAVEVGNPSTPLVTRRTAAIILKNLLKGHSTGELHGRWCSMDCQQRAEVTSLLLSSLFSEAKDLGLSVAQVVAEVAHQEMCSSKWTELVPALTGRLQSRELSCGQTEAALTCLGYIIEEARSSGLALPKQTVDQVLTAATACLRDDSQASRPRVAAGKALCAAIPCAGANFAEQHERDYLMQVISTGCVAVSEEVRAVSFECAEAACCTHIASMGTYLETLASASARCICYDSEEVAGLAIDLWCTTFSQLSHEDAVAASLGQTAARYLCEALLTRLMCQPEGEDVEEMEGGIAWAAADCLSLLLSVYGDQVFNTCSAFMNRNESRADWRCRDAAAVVIGALCSGLVAERMRHEAPGLLPVVFRRLGAEPHIRVQRSLLWAAGCLFDAVAEAPDFMQAVFLGDSFQQCLLALRSATRGPVLISEMACDSLGKLMVAAQRAMAPALAVQHFATVVGCLLSAAESSRPANEQLRLRMAAFGAVKDVVEATPTACCPLLADLVGMVARQLQDGTRRLDALAARQALTPIMSAYMKRMRDLQEFLCGVLGVIFTRVEKETGLDMLSRLPPCEDLMATLRRVLDQREGMSSSLEVLPLMATMATLWGLSFAPHMPTMWTPLYSVARDPSDSQGCVMALEAMCELYSSQQALVAPYHLHVLQLLEDHLDPKAPPGPEAPACLTLLGLVASAMGKEFLPYLEKSLSAVCRSADTWTRAVRGMSHHMLLGDSAQQLQLAALSSLCQLLQIMHLGLVAGLLEGTHPSQQNAAAILALVETSSGRLAGENGMQLARHSAHLVWFIATHVPSARSALQQSIWPRGLLQQCHLVPDLQDITMAVTQMLLY